MEIHRMAEELGELVGQPHEVEPWCTARAELHQQIHVTLRAEVLAQGGAKHSQALNASPAAEFRQL